MNRLSAEFDRLYAPVPPCPEGRLVDREGRVRLGRLALRAPADWRTLGTVWRCVQADLGWPAPAIAVSGDEALELWFSLAAPQPVAEVHAMLQALQRRYLPAVPGARVELWPPASGPVGEPVRVPREVGEERWSAFVAPDLAPVFEETPWLDLPPGEEAQLGVLSVLKSVTSAQWAAAAEALRDVTPPPPSAAPAAAPAAMAPPAPSTVTSPAGDADPRAFLRRVMNDEQVPLALRIEAARALLDAERR